MITHTNALPNILAYLLANPSRRVLISHDQLARLCETQTTLEAWGSANGLAVGIEGGKWTVAKEKSE